MARINILWWPTYLLNAVIDFILPRVLIVSPTRLNTQSATGTAMTMFFRGWPKDRLAQIHTDGFTQQDTSTVERSLFVDSRIGRYERIPFLGPRFVARFGRDGIWHQLLNADRAYRFARDFQPDVIYYRAVDRPRFYNWLPRKLSERMGVPLVTHIMDDWPARLARELAHLPGVLAKVDRQLRETFAASSVNLSICDKMSRGFGERYGVAFQSLHNCIDREEWTDLAPTRSFETDGTFRVVYSGGLASDMTRTSFGELARTIASLHERNHSIEFDVLGPPWHKNIYKSEVGNRPGVNYLGFVPREQYLQTLTDADLLVLPINFDARSLTYIRYSMANKAPEYMAAGRPILGYGPLDAATLGYAHDAGWARIVHEQNPGKLEAALLDLMHDPEQRRRLAARAQEVGRRHHDAAEHRQRFRALMSQAAYADAIEGDA